mmetsp:Transcript_3071/g.4738  ORF Transcript_3071/g.4738 Transcript_3071/m.4738 type:complete len:655 (+) Transcript_3071:1-1965(+)
MGMRFLLKAFTRNFHFSARRNLVPRTPNLRRLFSEKSSIEQLKFKAAEAEEQYGENSVHLISPYNMLGLAYRNQNDFSQAIEYFSKAIQLAEQELGKDNQELSVGYSNLANTYRSIGEAQKAIECHLKALRIDKLYCESNDKKIGMTYNNIATLYGDIGEFQKAMEYLELARPSMLQNQEEVDPNVATYFLNLGVLSRDKGASESLELIEKAKDIFEKLGPEHDLEKAECYVHAGLAHWTTQNYSEAAKCLKQAIAIREKSQEQDNILADWLNRLGTLYSNTGQPDLALKVFNKAIQRSKENPELWVYYNNIGNAYRFMGEPQKAEENFNQAMEIASQTFGETSKEYAMALDNLSSFFHAERKLKTALKHAQKALEIKESIKANNLDIVMSYNNIGSVFHKQEQNEKAKEYIEKARSLMEKGEVKDDAFLVNVLNNLGQVYRDAQQNSQALECFNQALQIAERIYGPNHISMAEINANLGVLMTTTEDYDKALEYHQKAVDISRAQAETDLQTALYLDFLGDAYRSKMGFEKAVEIHQKALQIRRELVGENHFLVGLSYHNLAYDYKYQRNFDRAIEFHDKGVSNYTKTYGKMHPYVAGSYVLMGETYEMKGEVREAVRYYQEAQKMFRKIYGGDSEVTQKLQERIENLQKGTS